MKRVQAKRIGSPGRISSGHVLRPETSFWTGWIWSQPLLADWFAKIGELPSITPKSYGQKSTKLPSMVQSKQEMFY